MWTVRGNVDVGTLLMVSCALIVAGIAIEPRLKRSSSSVEEHPLKRDVWNKISQGGHRNGSATAPVQLVVFTDYQCPACSRFEPKLTALLAMQRDDVSVVYRNFPISSIHRDAVAAALAAECAAEQGGFEAMRESLYRHQPLIGTKSWEWFFQNAALSDTSRFNACMTAMRYRQTIAEDSTVGQQIGVRGTPTIVVNGRVLTGTLSSEELNRQVRRHKRDKAAYSGR
ncbi:MAG TPA: thioredoxin domain-containing protein [Gemmatimonadaceae bacterium]|nr:thioredoxin domain-containing protein [Gemmatimonadaceae bacterium]